MGCRIFNSTLMRMRVLRRAAGSRRRCRHTDATRRSGRLLGHLSWPSCGQWPAQTWVFVDETASLGLQVEATTSAIAAEGGGCCRSPSRRRCPVDVDPRRTNTDRRHSPRWLGAASQQTRRAAARPLPLHASSARLGRTDLSGGHHRQGTACGLVRPRPGDVDHPRQVRRQETQARS